MRGHVALAGSVLSSLLFASSLASAAVDLPVIAFDPGIPGGIPGITGPVASVTDYGAVADGVTDDLAAFQGALAALPGGGVLFVPAGDYFLNGSLEIGTDGIVLRGEGADRSRLLLGSASTASISVITYGRGDWQVLTEAPARGATTITVPDGSAFTVGEWAEIQMANDAALMYTDPAWDVSWAYDCRGQVFEVTAINGNQLTFRHPLYLDYPLADAPQIRAQHFVKHVGIERLYLERITNDSDVGTIQWKNAAYVWMREVESNQTRKSHISTETVIGCQIENNYFHHSYDYGGGGHGYGTSLGFHTTDCLVENNVFRSLRHAMIIQSGASGNVFGYNHSDEIVQSEGSVLNEGWLPPDISVHGHWSNNNLFESNTVEQVGIADYWGPTGPHVAYLRNRVVNDEVRSDGRGENEAIGLDDYSNYQYLLGNVVEIGTLQDDGTPDMTTNVIHGHVESSATVWDPDIDDHEIPVSYYWGCRPNFLGDKAWPLVGPDVTPSVDLPAGDRFASGAFIAPSYERGCDDGSPNPGTGGSSSGTGGSGGITATGGSGGVPGTGGGGGVPGTGGGGGITGTGGSGGITTTGGSAGVPGTGGGGGITGTGGGTVGGGPTSTGGAGPAASSTDEDSGCGCRAARRGPAGAWALACLALLGLLLRRRTFGSHTDPAR